MEFISYFLYSILHLYIFYDFFMRNIGNSEKTLDSVDFCVFLQYNKLRDAYWKIRKDLIIFHEYVI